MNNKFLQTNIENISIDFIAKVIEYAYTEGHNSHAPLGCSGDTFILFGNPRRKEISLRLHSGDVKLLVTDNCGGFLFHGGFDTSLLPITFISEQYFNIIENVIYLLDNEKYSKWVSESDKEKMFKSRNIFSVIHPELIF